MSVMYYIYGLIVAALLVTAVLIKYRNKGFRGEWILAGFLIAIISLPLGLVLSPVMQIMTRLFLPEGPFNQIFSVLSMFIILSICYTYLRKGSAILFVKVLGVSFLVLILVIVAWFSLSMSEGGMFMVIQEVNIPAGEKVRFVEITREELGKNPPLEKAMIAYTESNSSEFKVDNEDQGKVSDFFNKKRYAARFLFSISDGKSVSETRWYVFEKQYLFSITDAALEKDLNKIDITMGGEISEARIPKLKNIFESNGFSLSENYNIWRIPEKWNIMDERGSYEIWNQDGKLNVYKQEELTYEILKENGVLNVYDEYPGDIFFRIGGKYYRISNFFED
ncbi:MAG: hypothetical protein O8C62_04940 [Candidatus Methanoperedens sp.]|nr:hypothetical protein [Candidatus Methanoperedens sp.]